MAMHIWLTSTLMRVSTGSQSGTTLARMVVEKMNTSAVLVGMSRMASVSKITLTSFIQKVHSL